MFRPSPCRRGGRPRWTRAVPPRRFDRQLGVDVLPFHHGGPPSAGSATIGRNHAGLTYPSPIAQRSRRNRGSVSGPTQHSCRSSVPAAIHVAADEVDLGGARRIPVGPSGCLLGRRSPHAPHLRPPGSGVEHLDHLKSKSSIPTGIRLRGGCQVAANSESLGLLNHGMDQCTPQLRSTELAYERLEHRDTRAVHGYGQRS